MVSQDLAIRVADLGAKASKDEVLSAMGRGLMEEMGILGANSMPEKDIIAGAEKWLRMVAPSVCNIIRNNSSLSIIAHGSPGVATAAAIVALAKDLSSGFPLDSTQGAVYSLGLAFTSLLILTEGFKWFEQTYGGFKG